MSKIHCDVSLNTIDCEFPACAEGGEKPIRTRCFSCGQRACRTCSSVRPYAIYGINYGPRRICRDCEEQLAGVA